MAIFITSLLVSNITSSAKIVSLGFSISGLPLSFDAGTLLFPISYIFGDILTEVYGYKITRRIIWFGFICTALAGFTFWIVSKLPGDPQWGEFVANHIFSNDNIHHKDSLLIGQAAYNAILGGISTGGIIFASLIAYIAGEFSNSYILARMKILTRGRFLWTRTIGSSFFAQAIDSLIFVSIATLSGVFPASAMLSIIVANFIFKLSIEIIFTPVTYRVINFLKTSEQTDHYDIGTNFNPFSLFK